MTEFKPPSSGPEYVVLNHDRDTTLVFHDASLEMENQRAMEFCEAPTLESKEKDSTYEHESFSLEIAQKPCSFNAAPVLGTISSPRTHKNCNNLKVLPCKIFRRVVVDAFVYRKQCRFHGCTVALDLVAKFNNWW